MGMRPRLWLWSHVLSTCFSSTTKSSPSDSPATTSDRHSHLLPHSAGPSRKRCMSPTTTMPSSIPASRALSPTHADLYPPHKRFRDSYSSKDSIKEDIDADVLANIKADDVAAKVATDIWMLRLGLMLVGVDVVARIDIPVGMLMPDVVDHLKQLDEDEQQEASRHPEDGEYESRQIINIPRSGMTPEAIEEPISQRVAESLAAYEANHDVGLVVESQSQNGDDGDNGNGGGNGDRNGGGNGNRNGRGNGNGNPNRNGRGAMHVAQPTRLKDAIRIANNLMDRKLKGYAARSVENKKRLDNN
ncbi:hypothetical protein Tco_0432635 [Tanacetum coccineum]